MVSAQRIFHPDLLMSCRRLKERVKPGKNRIRLLIDPVLSAPGLSAPGSLSKKSFPPIAASTIPVHMPTRRLNNNQYAASDRDALPEKFV